MEKRVTIRLDDYTAKLLNEIIKRNGNCKQSKAIRKAISFYNHSLTDQNLNRRACDMPKVERKGGVDIYA